MSNDDEQLERVPAEAVAARTEPDGAPAEAAGSAEAGEAAEAGGELGRRARSFGAVAAEYDAARPTFPVDALDWVLDRPLATDPLTVLDLGAGTGKLAAVATGLGHKVLAVDPSEQMLAYCARIDGVVTAVGSAESIPLGDASVDAVIIGQAFHWFDPEQAIPEIARVLRPRGILGLLWNQYDVVVPWVRRFAAATGSGTLDGGETDVLLKSGLFGYIERTDVRHWQELDREGLRRLGLSTSGTAVLPADQRALVLEKLDALYAASARPPEPLRMPYITTCFRTQRR
jgi:SAM-dependent methyltransferase